MGKTTTDQAIETVFTKEQLLRSTQFSVIHKDVLNALLEEEQGYSIQQAKQIIEDFEKKEAR